MKTLIARAAAIAFAFSLFLGTSSAGVVLQFETGKAGGGEGSEGSVLLGADRLRLEQGGSVAVFRGDKQLMWIIDEKKGRYIEMTKEQMQRVGAQVSGAMAQLQESLKSLPPEQRAKVEEMMRMNVPSAEGKQAEALKFVKTDKSETIHGYPCVAYDALRGDKREQQIWVTDWKRFDLTAADFKVLGQMATFLMDSVGPLAKKFSTGLAQRYSDTEVPDALPGVPIRVVTFTEGKESVMEIKKIAREEVAASRFEVPAGLKKEEMGPELEGDARNPRKKTPRTKSDQ